MFRTDSWAVSRHDCARRARRYADLGRSVDSLLANFFSERADGGCPRGLDWIGRAASERSRVRRVSGGALQVDARSSAFLFPSARSEMPEKKKRRAIGGTATQAPDAQCQGLAVPTSLASCECPTAAPTEAPTGGTLGSYEYRTTAWGT